MFFRIRENCHNTNVAHSVRRMVATLVMKKKISILRNSFIAYA
jgi:hypothetical protein